MSISKEVAEMLSGLAGKQLDNGIKISIPIVKQSGKRGYREEIKADVDKAVKRYSAGHDRKAGAVGLPDVRKADCVRGTEGKQEVRGDNNPVRELQGSDK
jgi:hypothetical protein